MDPTDRLFVPYLIPSFLLGFATFDVYWRQEAKAAIGIFPFIGIILLFIITIAALFALNGHFRTLFKRVILSFVTQFAVILFLLLPIFYEHVLAHETKFVLRTIINGYGYIIVAGLMGAISKMLVDVTKE